MQVKNYLLFFLAATFLSACEKEEEVNETGKVYFATSDIREVENASIPLGINIGIDNAFHRGGTIELDITGGTYGTDFTTSGEASTFTLEVAPGALYAGFSIQPVDDEIIEDDKTLAITIRNTTGSLELGDITSFNFTIIDNDEYVEPDPVALDFGSPDAVIIEDAGVLNISVVAASPAFKAGTVEVRTSTAATANPANDFTLNGENQGTFLLSFPEGSTEASFEIAINDDKDMEEDEQIVLELANPSEGLTLGTTSTTLTLLVRDNDQGPPPFVYLENFETNDGTLDYLNVGLGYQNILTNQTIADAGIITLITSAGAFSDENNIDGVSDNGLNLFYNTGQSAANEGEIDNLVISPLMDGAGAMTFEVDMSYAFLNQNNGEVMFYWSQNYDGSGEFKESDWEILGTETAAKLNTAGFGNNIYSRKSFSFTADKPFYLAIRVQQTMDGKYYRTRWRFDNLRVFN